MSHQPAPPSAGAHPQNGVVTAASGRGAVGVNKKKQKRRAKQAAKAAADADYHHQTSPSANGQPSNMAPDPYHTAPHVFGDIPYDPQQYPDDLDYTSDEDDDSVAYDPRQHQAPPPGELYLDDLALPTSRVKRSRRQTGHSGVHSYASGPAAMVNSAMSRFPLPNPPPPLHPGRNRNGKGDRIWNTSTQEERERIKEFWLSLSEEERRGLLKIEKTAVLNKMKEQQKHSCSCTVCGRKRTAIEEELEVLYDAYYEELAQYANQPHQDPTDLLQQRRNSLINHHVQSLPPPRPSAPPQLPHHRTSRVHEIIDDVEDGYSDREDDVYSDEDDELYSDEEDYESDEVPAIGTGFFDFGNNLTVKGGSFITDMLTKLHGRLNNLPDGILTVADDLLKNDGRKFIEMMEQLAERRMRREEAVEYAAQQQAHPHSEPPLDDEDDYDDDEDYDSQEDYDDDEEEDEMGGMTEEQRMEEGRRMFQIFAARMFEQRVLTAYREKVALERQSRLLQELEDESKAKSQKDAKKAKDAEKKKNKKLAQKAAKAEEKAKKDAEKAAEEAAAKAAEEKRLEEQRKKKEEQKRKREAEKKLQEQEKAKKEADRLKRQQEERDRQAETERKNRELKALEKRQKDDARKKEKTEREAREREAREQKAHDDKLRKEQDAIRQQESKSQEQAVKEKKPAVLPAQTPQIVKRQSHQGQVAVPPVLVSQKSSVGLSSPAVAVATPAIPKSAAPATVKQRSGSEHDSSQISPAHYPAGIQSRKVSPGSRIPEPQQQSPVPKTILQNPLKQQQQSRPVTNLPPAPTHNGVNHDTQTPLTQGYGHMGYSNAGPPGSGLSFPNQQRPGQQFPIHPPNGPHPPQFQAFKSGPPGHRPVNGFGGLPPDRPFVNDAPPGFPAHMPGLGPPHIPSGRAPGQGHARQQSISNDLESSPSAHAQPMLRPTPIQRPSSVRPSPDGSNLDDLSRHLGSSALIDDTDDPQPPLSELRRTSNPLGTPRVGSIGFSSPLFTNAPGFGSASSGSWTNPGAFAAPPSATLSTPTWGSTGLGSSSLSSNAFGPRTANPNRSRAVRMAVCHACRQLSTSQGEYHDVNLVLSQINRNATLDGVPSLREIEDICDTEGDAHNGGGLLHVRRLGGSGHFAIAFEQDGDLPGAHGPRNTLGEIGSPIPSNSVPAFGAGRGSGFGTIGGLASPGGF